MVKNVKSKSHGPTVRLQKSLPNPRAPSTSQGLAPKTRSNYPKVPCKEVFN